MLLNYSFALMYQGWFNSPGLLRPSHRRTLRGELTCVAKFFEEDTAKNFIWVGWKRQSPSDDFINNRLLFTGSAAKINARSFYAFVSHQVGK